MNCFHAGGFILNCLQQVKRIFAVIYDCNGSYRSYISIYVCALIIAVLPGISSIMTLFWNFGGICEDIFGSDFYSIGISYVSFSELIINI